MKHLILILFLHSPLFSYAGDDLAPAVLIATPTSQNETQQSHLTSQSEHITLDIQDVISREEVTPTSENKKSFYLKVLEGLRDKAPKKVESTLTKLKVSPEFQKFILKDLNHQLQHAPDAIMTANASGFGVRPVIMGGLGLSDYLINKMSQTKWGHLVPKKTNFGVVLATGLAILSYEKNGRKHLLIRTSVQYEKPVAIINWMAEVFAGAVGTKLSDTVDLNAKKIQFESFNYEKSNLGLAGTMTTHNGSFEHAYPIGFGFGAGPVSFYKLSVHERRLSVSIDIQAFINLKNKVVKTCSQVLRIKPSASK